MALKFNMRLSQIELQFSEVSKKYQDLVFMYDPNGQDIMSGHLRFSATYKETTLSDCFNIELIIPKDYSRTVPPIANEVGGRIPNDYHTNLDGSLCLGTPLEVREKFYNNPRLLGFIDDLLIPFLFSFCYREKYGQMPYGEFSHGGKGILEFYMGKFDITSNINCLQLLKILAVDKYRAHFDCPCGKGIRLRHCHGPILQKLKGFQNQREFLHDFLQCLLHIKNSNEEIPPSLNTEKLKKVLLRYGKKFDKNEKRGAGTIQKQLASKAICTPDRKNAKEGQS